MYHVSSPSPLLWLLCCRQWLRTVQTGANISMQAWCGDGGVRPLTSMQEYEDFMVYGQRCRPFQDTEIRRKEVLKLEELCYAFGSPPWVPGRQHLQLQPQQEGQSGPPERPALSSHNCEEACVEQPASPINQEDSAFTVDEMKDFLSYVAVTDGNRTRDYSPGICEPNLLTT